MGYFQKASLNCVYNRALSLTLEFCHPWKIYGGKETFQLHAIVLVIHETSVDFCKDVPSTVITMFCYTVHPNIASATKV